MSRLISNTRMKTTRVAGGLFLALAVTIGFICPRLALGQDRRNFWFLNNTGAQIDRIYVSPHERTSWENDMLGNAVLANNVGFKISFGSDYYSSCVMDFKLVFHDGTEQTYTKGFNTCSLHAVVFDPEEANGY